VPRHERLLLDTVALLRIGVGNVAPKTVARIEAASEVAYSVISLLEIATKVSVGKLVRPPRLLEMVHAGGLTRLGIEDTHVVRYEGLPWLHRDPWDRLIIAQALEGRYTVATSDEHFAQYGVSVLPL
jgi:PIN domain nuclease of toxin-antitoxin system